MNQPKSVFISGPYTRGNVNENVWLAIEAAETITACSNLIPFIPHLTHFWDFLKPHPWQFWMDIDLYFLSKCDYVLRLPGESTGADMEVTRAFELGMPVFFSVDDLLGYVNMQNTPIENPANEYWFANEERSKRYTDIVSGKVTVDDLQTPEEFELYLSLGGLDHEKVSQIMADIISQGIRERFEAIIAKTND